MPSSTPHVCQRRRHLLLAGAGLALSSAAVTARTSGSGRVQREPRSVPDFDAIAVSGAIDLQVRQGSTQALELSADDNILPLVETVVEPGRHGHTLHIRIKRGESVGSQTPIQATVDVVRLQALVSAGSGQVRVAALKTPSLRLSVAGSGRAQLDALTTDALDLRVAGSGEVRAAGTAGKVKLTIAGSGDVNLAPLAADEVIVSIAGSGDARVTANKSLGVTIAGSGDVVYGGTATAVRTSVAGSGRATRR